MAEYKILGRANEKPNSGYKILGRANEEPQSDEMPEEESWYAKLPRNIVAGLGQMQRRLFNAPHDVTEQLENSLQGLGAPFMNMELQQLMKRNPHNPLSSHIPHQSEKDFAKFFGQQGEGTLLDNLIQKGVEYAPEIGSLGLLLRELPITTGPGSRALNEVKKQIKERGITNLNLPPHIIKDIKNNQFLRNTQSNRNLLDKAKKGNYEDLFNLQQELGSRSRALKRDPFSSANRDFGKDIGESRTGLLNHVRGELGSQGHNDLAELMKFGQNRYRQAMKLRPYLLGAGGIALGGIPGYKYLKKLIP